MRRQNYILAAILLFCAALSPARAAEVNFRGEEIHNGLDVGYAVSLVDMNEDGRPDVVIVDSKRVIWLENPTWAEHTLIEDQTIADNVSIAPYDIDRDGKLDFALAAHWKPGDTVNSGTLQWLRRGAAPGDRWIVHPIAKEPTIHRIRWADLDADGRAELIVVPLFGRGSRGPRYEEAPLRILAFSPPADPARDAWPVTTINEELHVAHNFWPTDFNDDSRLDILVASFEGVSLLERGSDGSWKRTLVGEGNQQTSPNRGASEVKLGKRSAGKYIATIEPWHGFQVVVYTPPMKSGADAAPPGQGSTQLWRRQLLDDQLQWGHAVWCADLDGDADEELIIGVRDNKDDSIRSGLRIYDPLAADGPWPRQLVDPGGVAIEDLAAADMNGDGRIDVVAVGRQTHNAKIYWNEGPKR